MVLNNLVIRTRSGIFFVISLVGSILLGPYAFISVFALITGFLLVEFYRLMNANQGVRLDIWSNMSGGVLLFLGAGAFSMGIEGRLCFVPYLAYLLYLFIH